MKYLNISKIRNFIFAHKIVSGIAAIIIIYVGYKVISGWGSSSTTTRYVIAAAEKGTIVSSVTGTGQVSAGSQVDLTSKVSGNVISLPVIAGSKVKAGDLIAQIDSKNAGIDLQSARISLQKLTAPADAATLLQSQNSLADAKDAAKKAEDTLVAYYNDGLSNVSAAFVDLPGVINDLESLLVSPSGFLNSTSNLYYSNSVFRTNRDIALRSFNLAKSAYEVNLANLRDIKNGAATSSIENIITETYNTTKLTAEAIKNTKNTLDFVQISGDISSSNSSLTSAQTTINNWVSKINTHLSSLITSTNNIQNGNLSVTSTKRAVEQASESLDELIKGADPLDIQSQQLSVQQKQNTYQDYFIRAPFDGVVAKVDITKTSSVSGGTQIATVITDNYIAEVSLNEVDAAKVKNGQKATLTFDAIDGLSIAGKVVEIDLVGTATQGVVSYNAKIDFETGDDRIRSGMSISANIVTDVRQDVITVPNSAIKIQNDTHYVETVDSGTAVSSSSQGDALTITPAMKEVEVGISDDSSTEIISGLTEGEKIITRTITSSATTQTTTASSLFGGGKAR